MTIPQRFRYTRASFRPLPVKLEHVDISLNFLESEVEGRITLHMTARESLERLRLDANELRVHGVWEGEKVSGFGFQEREGRQAEH